MNMIARFDENPAMILQDIKETKCYGRTHGQRENSIPTTNKVFGRGGGGGGEGIISMFRLMGLKILGRVGTHIFLIIFFSGKMI